MFLALTISLWSLGFDFVTHLLIISQRWLSGQPARYWNRPTSEGQFPFPLALSFGIAGLIASSKLTFSAFVVDVERGSSSFKPL
jgi:hypothetical protein